MERYCSVFDEFYGCLAVEGEFELVAEFEDEELLCVGVAVEVLLAGPGDVSVGLHDCIGVGLLLRKEWWSNLQVTYWVLAELMGFGMLRVFGSQVFFQPVLVQKRLLSLMRNTISINYHQQKSNNTNNNKWRIAIIATANNADKSIMEGEVGSDAGLRKRVVFVIIFIVDMSS